VVVTTKQTQILMASARVPEAHKTTDGTCTTSKTLPVKMRAEGSQINQMVKPPGKDEKPASLYYEDLTLE
jgi:hypothetical protein